MARGVGPARRTALGLATVIVLTAPSFLRTASAQEVGAEVVTQAVAPLNFRQNEPQVHLVKPRFIVPNRRNDPVGIEFQGAFIDSSKKGLEATLLVNGHRYQVTQNTTRNLLFVVPLADLLADQSRATSRGFTYGTAILTVRWRAYWFAFSKNHSARYRVAIGILPASPGKITLAHDVTRQVSRVRRFTTQRYTQIADHGDDIDRAYSVSASKGWEIVRNTVEFRPVGQNKGEWHWNLDGDDENKVRWRVTTRRSGPKGVGKIEWMMSFTETRSEPESETITEEVYLKWGDSRSFPYPAGTWRVSFDAFDGSHNEFRAAGTTNPFLKLQDQGGALTIGTAEPASLMWP